MDINRRNYLAATGGALFAAATAALPAQADGNNSDDTLYGHGMSWNPDLPGDAGKLRLVFDIWANVDENRGTGTAEDAVRADWGIHFVIDSIKVTKLPKDNIRFDMRGVITESKDPAKVGLPVVILAETSRDSRPSAIRVADLVFGIAGVVSFRGTRLEIK